MAITNPEVDPLWYKDAILYEVHVRAFHDSNGDGVGDFRGLTSRLDYLQDLGITGIWLLPFYPSPLRDDGYDIADYLNIHPSYGTLRDFKLFLREAHTRGLQVVTELVLNHTSDQHAWFQRARTAEPNSVWRNYYVWSDTPDKYPEARVIFQDFEHSNWTWDPVARGYYWHRFYTHQPDLNYDSPGVAKTMFQVLDFWLGMGVDALRLDAVPYLFEREGSNCENLADTHAFLKKLRRHVDERFPGRMILAEANQWPEHAIAYFGDGDECHMAYHFPLMPRLFMAIRMEDRFPIIDILAQTPPIPESSQWALFLRNHDELTLEMVSDEERDYMYRVYARDPEAKINLGIRRRLAPLLGNHRRRIELMNGLLFSLPGTPVIYYGDEIGMGDNIFLGDRNGVRTPMQWSADRNAGFSRANPQRLYLPIIIDPEYHYETVNVESQQNNPHSLLWWMKRLMALRKRYKAFGRGSLGFLHPENHKVLAFVRRHENEQILVVANLSRFVQYVELNLAEFRGMMPIEMFGHTEFPAIGESPYLLTLGPHAFYWFALEPQRLSLESPPSAAAAARIPALVADGTWEAILEGKARDSLQAALPGYLRTCRWFGGKARRIKATSFQEIIPVPLASGTSYLTLVTVDYAEGDPESYLLPLTFAGGERAAQLSETVPQAIVAHLQVRARGQQTEGVLYDALWEDGFSQALLDTIARRRRLKGSQGELLASANTAFRQIRGAEGAPLAPSISQAEQSNSSVIFGDRLFLKIFRRLGEGLNPDLEIGRFLTERTTFTHLPPVVGALEYRAGRSQPMTLAILQGFVPNQGDAWRYTIEALGQYFERVAARQHEPQEAPPPPGSLLDLAAGDLSPLASEAIGTYLESARLLGERTAELHLALASQSDDPAFAPEPFSAHYQRSIYQSMRGSTSHTFQLLHRRLIDLPEEVQAEARRVLAHEGEILRRFQSIVERKISVVRIRCHGDYHLGQVLYTGKDFVVIDFEGEPARPLSERRIKRSPLRDVAGLLRSFHYAAYTALFSSMNNGLVRAQDAPILERWAGFWHTWVSATFLKAYFETAGQTPFIPRERDELDVLLQALLLEKAVYELGYELNNRPTWAAIPLRGLLYLVE